jgi:hypothetical protein
VEVARGWGVQVWFDLISMIKFEPSWYVTCVKFSTFSIVSRFSFTFLVCRFGLLRSPWSSSLVQLCSIRIHAAPRPFLWECHIFRANGGNCFAAIETFAEKVSQRSEIAAGVLDVGIDVRPFASRVVACRCQRHIPSTHDVLSYLLNAVSYNERQLVQLFL